METRKTVSLDEFWDISIKPKTLNLNSMSEEELKAEIEKGYKKPTVKDTGATDPEEILYFLSHGFKPKLLSKSELDAIKVANDEVINDKLNNIESKSGEISDKYNPDQMKKATLVEGEIAFAISEATGIPVLFDGQAVENFNIGDHHLFEMKNDEASARFGNLFVEVSARTNASELFHFGSATNILCEKENYSKYLATKCFQGEKGKEDEVIYLMNREAISRFFQTATTNSEKTIEIKTAVGVRHSLEEADRVIATEEGCLKLKKEGGRWVIDTLEKTKKEIAEEWRKEMEADKRAGKVTTLTEIETISHKEWEDFYKFDAFKKAFAFEKIQGIEKMQNWPEKIKALEPLMKEFSTAPATVSKLKSAVDNKLEKVYNELKLSKKFFESKKTAGKSY